MAIGRNNRTQRANKPPPSGKAPRVQFGSREAGKVNGELPKVEHFAEICQWVIEAGDAVMLSTTSDGGAIVVTVLAGDSREKAYAAGQLELNGVFDLIEQAYSPD